MTTQAKWWRAKGSLVIQEIEQDWRNGSRMLSVASLRSSGGWRTFRGAELVFKDQGEVLDALPRGLGVTIHTLAAAKIIRNMAALSVIEATAIYDDCRQFIDENMEVVRSLGIEDPTLIAMRNYLFDCSNLKGWPHSRKSIEKATHLAAHLEYLKQLVSRKKRLNSTEICDLFPALYVENTSTNTGEHNDGRNSLQRI